MAGTPTPPVNPGTASGAIGSGAGKSTAQPQTAVAQKVADAVAKLPADSLISARIQAKSGNELVLQTALGNATVKLPHPLPANLADMLWVRIMPQPGGDASGAMRLQILPQTLMPGTGGGAAVAAGNTAGGLSAPMVPGQVFSAVTTSPLSLPGGTTLPTGSQLQVVFAGAGTASPTQAANLIAANTATTGTTTPINAPGAQSLPAGSASPATNPNLAGQAPNAAQIAARGAPSAPSPASVGGFGASTALSSPSTPLVLTGTVLPPNSAEAQQLPTGFTALRTPAGIVGVKLPVPAPVGAQLSFAVDNDMAARGARLPLPPLTEADLLARGHTAQLSHDWDSLRTAAATLAQADPQAASALLNQIPSPGPRLTTTMVFFLSAVTGSGGRLRNWLGDSPVHKIAEHDSELLKKLDSDFSTLRNITAEHRPDGWRVMPMPFQMGERIEQVRLAWRNGDEDGDGKQSSSDDPGTRFLLDLSFSHVGHTQLDGLVQTEKQKFDLIVRTENPLEGHNRDDIRAIFRDALSITGLAGGLVFQDSSRFVDLPDPAEQNSTRRGLEA